MSIEIDCQKCGGTGRVQMSDELLATLQAVGKESTVAEVQKKVGWTGHPTAINNRLEFLREAGFISRNRVGRQWVYQKIITPKPRAK